MNIALSHISKRFQKHWIFKDVSCTFMQPGAYALLGPNGSGKSTLLRIMAGMQSPSLGKALYHDDAGAQIAPEQVHSYVSFSAPGMELVEELSLKEFLDFHFSFKKPLPGLDTGIIIDLCGLKGIAGKPIGDYSSGMKQRVKLAQAIFADTPVLLLDEPCSNLDQAGVDQYHAWIERYGKRRLIVIASNDEREYHFCRERLVIEDYK